MQLQNEHQAAIEFFERHPTSFILQFSRNTFIKVQATSHFYRFSNNDVLGVGSFATTYKCYRFNPVTFIEEEAPFACKKLNDKKQFVPQELTILKQFYFAEPFVEDGEHIYLIQEFFPGNELLNMDCDISPSLANLSWQETLDILCSISLAVNLLHHDTPRTGPALAHTDISGINMKVQRTGNHFNVYIFDFGLSERLPFDGAELLSIYCKGNRFYAPPETSFCRYSVKFDVHCLAPIFMKLFKAEDPFSFRKGLVFDRAVQKPFNFSGLLVPFLNEVSTAPHPIRELIFDFLQRMCSFSPELRPDSDQVLRFTTSLRKYFLLLANDPTNPDLHQHAAQLALLATNLWIKTVTGEQIVLTLEQAKAINSEFQNDNLNMVSLMRVTAPSQVVNYPQILQVQLVELRSYNYSDYVYQALEETISTDPVAGIKLFQKIRSFTFQEHLNFKLLISFYKKYAEVNQTSLNNAVNGQNPDTALCASLEHHHSNLCRSQLGLSLSWARFWRISIADEIAITTRILAVSRAGGNLQNTVHRCISPEEKVRLSDQSRILPMLKDWARIHSLREKYQDRTRTIESAPSPDMNQL